MKDILVHFCRRFGFACVCAGAFLLAGCSIFMRPTPAPIPVVERLSEAGKRAGTLVVFLPGRGDPMTAFEEQGCIAMMREAGVVADVVMVDGHLGYYYNRTVVERLHLDVIAPARAKGYKRIVLVGVSLGGLGSLLYERDHPRMVDGIVLIGPYLGDRAKLLDAIESGGGPAIWAGGRDPAAGDVQEQIWTFLGGKHEALPPVWLVSGEQDRLGRGQRMLAALLGQTQVRFAGGGHDWLTWKPLWRELCVRRDLFPR